MNKRISDSKNDPRGLWKNLKTLLPGKKQNTISSLETESGTVTNDTELANAINKCFATFGQKLASKFEGSDNTTTSTFGVQSHDNPSFCFSKVTVSQVLKQLKKLNVNKANVHTPEMVSLVLYILPRVLERVFKVWESENHSKAIAHTRRGQL